METSCPRPDGLSDSPFVLRMEKAPIVVSFLCFLILVVSTLGPFTLKWLVQPLWRWIFLSHCFTQAELEILSVKLLASAAGLSVHFCDPSLSLLYAHTPIRWLLTKVMESFSILSFLERRSASKREQDSEKGTWLAPTETVRWTGRETWMSCVCLTPCWGHPVGLGYGNAHSSLLCIIIRSMVALVLDSHIL